MLKLYTYHSHVPGLNIEHETKMILLWQEHHRRLGCDPIVLNEYIARKHPDYEQFCERIVHLPSINPGSYDRACYLRWMAMAVTGGGIMMDYDTFIYDLAALKLKKGRATCYQGHVPSLFSAPAHRYQAMVKAILEYQVGDRDKQENGKHHVSDMYLLLHKVIEFEPLDVVKMYGEPGWETAPAVHFSTSSMQPSNKMPRFQWIPRLRKS